MRFQKSPFSSAFPPGRLSVDDRRQRIKEYAFSNENAYSVDGALRFISVSCFNDAELKIALVVSIGFISVWFQAGPQTHIFQSPSPQRE